MKTYFHFTRHIVPTHTYTQTKQKLSPPSEGLVIRQLTPEHESWEIHPKAQATSVDSKQTIKYHVTCQWCTCEGLAASRLISAGRCVEDEARRAFEDLTGSESLRWEGTREGGRESHQKNYSLFSKLFSTNSSNPQRV